MGLLVEKLALILGIITLMCVFSFMCLCYDWHLPPVQPDSPQRVEMRGKLLADYSGCTVEEGACEIGRAGRGGWSVGEGHQEDMITS